MFYLNTIPVALYMDIMLYFIYSNKYMCIVYVMVSFEK